MLDASIRTVVGIDIAKRRHVACALDAPTGAVRQRTKTIEATAEGYRELCRWLASWGASETILIGVEATGCLWEPLYDALTHAGYQVVVLNPRQTSAWAASLGLRAKTDGLDAQTLARGLVAGYARASVVPPETVQALRELTRARRDLVQTRTATRQRLLDELVLVFPELPDHTPGRCDLATPALLHLLGQYGSAQALAAAPVTAVVALLTAQSNGRWGETQATALQDLARRSAASTRAVAARGVVVRTFARHLLELQQHIADLETALADALQDDEPGQRLRQIPGIGQIHAATIRAELGDVTRFAHVDQVIAYAGLEPRTRQSGAFEGQRKLSKRGPGALRHALYLAAVVATRYRDEWRERYHRLLDRGRAKKEALTILSRAMLKTVYHLLVTGDVYDPVRLKPRAGAGLDTGI
jgi:transposase